MLNLLVALYFLYIAERLKADCNNEWQWYFVHARVVTLFYALAAVAVGAYFAQHVAPLLG